MKIIKDIKPIETVYNGYKFRSRLEARWAVFFDELGVKYEYEPEGFDLGDELGWYLPDFWLPELDAIIEIKPTNGDRSTVFRQLTAILDRSFTVKQAWGLFGDPLEHYWMLPVFSSDDSKELKWYEEWKESTKIGFEFINSHWIVFATSECVDIGLKIDNYKERIAARQARFEHGQVGAPKQWK